jgi:hypothetical protein
MRAGRRPLVVLFATAVLLGTSCSDSPERVGLYTTTAPPPVPAQTRPIDPAWVEASGETLGTTVASGQYWATLTGVGIGADDRQFVDFDLAQAFFGDACLQHFGDPDECLNDYGVQDDPHGTLPAFATELAVVSVAGADQRNFAITGAELVALANGAPPSAPAPDDYAFAPFPFLVTVTDGRITAAQQIWTP